MMNRKATPPANTFAAGASSGGQLDLNRIRAEISAPDFSESVVGNSSPFLGAIQAGGGEFNQQQQHIDPRNAKPLPVQVPLSKFKRPLPVDYVPSPHTVVIGRGKFCTDATGSKRLQVIAATFLDQYTAASTKVEKSKIVSSIVDIVEDGCPYGGAFVRFIGGRWWEVDGMSAREKVGYVLRDLLHDKYRSSSKSKAANRRRQSASSKTKSPKAKKKSKSNATAARRSSRGMMMDTTDETCSQSSWATQSSSDSFSNNTVKPSFSNEELQLGKRGSSSDDLYTSSNELSQMGKRGSQSGGLLQVPTILFENNHGTTPALMPSSPGVASSTSAAARRASTTAAASSIYQVDPITSSAAASASLQPIVYLPPAPPPMVQQQQHHHSPIMASDWFSLRPTNQDDLRGGLQRHKSWPQQVQTVPYFAEAAAAVQAPPLLPPMHTTAATGPIRRNLEEEGCSLLDVQGDCDPSPLADNDLSNIFD